MDGLGISQVALIPQTFGEKANVSAISAFHFCVGLSFCFFSNPFLLLFDGPPTLPTHSQKFLTANSLINIILARITLMINFLMVSPLSRNFPEKIKCLAKGINL
jgi:hypothetical protein